MSAFNVINIKEPIIVLSEGHTDGSVGYKFVYKTLITNPNWLRVVDKAGTWNASVSYNCFNYDDSEAEPIKALETRPLTQAEREDLEMELPF